MSCTTRERRVARIKRRHEWAESAKRKGEEGLKRAEGMDANIQHGQTIYGDG